MFQVVLEVHHFAFEVREGSFPFFVNSIQGEFELVVLGVSDELVPDLDLQLNYLCFVSLFADGLVEAADGLPHVLVVLHHLFEVHFELLHSWEHGVSNFIDVLYVHEGFELLRHCVKHCFLDAETEFMIKRGL